MLFFVALRGQEPQMSQGLEIKRQRGKNKEQWGCDRSQREPPFTKHLLLPDVPQSAALWNERQAPGTGGQRGARMWAGCMSRAFSAQTRRKQDRKSVKQTWYILDPSTKLVSMRAGRAASDVDFLLRSRSRSLSLSLSFTTDEASPARRCLFFWASMALSFLACLWPL